MKTFFRIFDDKLHGVQTEEIGFSIEDPSYIPDEVLERQRFMVMRTCHGLGDWVLLSAIPRLLKNKYPNCKVYIPSKKLLKKIFGNMLNTWGYGTFDASTISEIIFKNNPYVDDFVDEFNDEIFHDHYKIFNPDKDEISLAEQMLRFWQFKDSEMLDTTPDFYPTESEKVFLKQFNSHYKLNYNYSYISVSSTFENTAEPDVLLDKIKEKDSDDMKWLYYGEVPLKDSMLNFLDAVEIKEINLDIRQQQILKVNAKYNFGNETGMNLWTPKYSETYVLGNKYYGPIHGGNNEGKVRKRPFKSGNFVNRITYL
tara:strand:+ start:195 stop:1130 length:936 start_codon:yes stop_codon:yes gene_type:complete